MPGEDTWLVAEYRSSGERKYHLSNPAQPPDLQAFEAFLPVRDPEMMFPFILSSFESVTGATSGDTIAARTEQPANGLLDPSWVSRRRTASMHHRSAYRLDVPGRQQELEAAS